MERSGLPKKYNLRFRRIVMAIEDYSSDTVFCDSDGEGYPPDLEKIIGKKVKRIENYEYSLKVIFEDDSFIECISNTYDGAALDVETGFEEDCKCR